MLSAFFSFIGANIMFFILHIQSSSCFPKPLSVKEEREYLSRMAQGDPDARAVLIERNLRLVSHICKKYYSKTNDNEDLISIGTIGLIKAVDSFDYTKGTRLSTYASRCVENEILMYFRSLKKQNGEIFMGDTLETDKQGNPLTVEDLISDDTDIVEELEKKRRIGEMTELIRNMTDEREKEIIILRYGLNNAKPLTQREVAERLNISRSYVSRIEKKVLEDLRNNID
ncbi:RNA polymerase sporulation sigma factor SigK [uncultured Eubacterium sp.]|uniref:RNA polymerase sporulation sigma factor SigK n=1 Tax=uncultured Eubacterium sp. TaxID=165185 RepID=UPI0015A93CF1|nr:RNA polymerase sporulation sigma factor SigK [uncultured Eubacterium sp.]